MNTYYFNIIYGFIHLLEKHILEGNALYLAIHYGVNFVMVVSFISIVYGMDNVNLFLKHYIGLQVES